MLAAERVEVFQLSGQLASSSRRVDLERSAGNAVYCIISFLKCLGS